MEKVSTQKSAINTKYNFEYGLPGFEHLSEFEFIDLEDYPPFKLFRSTEMPEIAMIVMDSKLLHIYETVALPKYELDNLQIKEEKYLRSFVILRMDEKKKNFVANTKAPIILNTYKGIGKQIIIDNSELSEDYSLENL